MKTTEVPIVLASASPRRRELLSVLGIRFDVQPADIDESVEASLPPDLLVQQLAERKAEKIAADRTEGIVIGSDTVVVHDGRVLGKPSDEKDAYRMLSMLQGDTHYVYSGLCVIDANSGSPMKSLQEHEIEAYTATGEPTDKAGDCDTTMHLGDIGRYRVISESPNGKPEIIVGHTVSKVTFRQMSEEDIKAYVKTGEPLDKAGAYGVQGIGSVFIEKIEGDFYSIMGLPLNLLYQMLLKFGVSPLKSH